MDNWADAIQFIIPVFIGVIALYSLIHMGINWLKGRDIIDGLFVFKRRKRNQDEPD